MPIFKLLLNDFTDLIFPRCCEACDQSLVGNERVICTACRISLPRIENGSSHHETIKYKFVHVHEVMSIWSFLLFTKRGNVQKLLHALKYKGVQEVGLTLGSMFGEEMKAANKLPNAEVIISVPLHKKRIASRGYNQSDLLANGLSEATGIPWSGDALRRTKNTTSQTGKSKKERHENVESVFIAEKDLKYNSVILIDDVLTTGATIEACIEALKLAGCKEFHVLTIAVAQY